MILLTFLFKEVTIVEQTFLIQFDLGTILAHSQTQTVINVALKEDLQVIEDIVITAEKKVSDGTFEIPQREITTAVQTISSKAFEGVQVTSIDEAMQGRIAGLDIVSNSGDLGSGATMRIRGTSSINANTQPLIVVNGIPYEINIDPSFDFAAANEEQ